MSSFASLVVRKVFHRDLHSKFIQQATVRNALFL